MKSLSEHINKTYIVSINEKLRPADASIMQMLKFFADNTSGYQQMLYNDKVEDADSVDIISIYDVFDEFSTFWVPAGYAENDQSYHLYKDESHQYSADKKQGI